MTQMTQATQQKIVSNMHIALPCDAVELVSESASWAVRL